MKGMRTTALLAGLGLALAAGVARAQEPAQPEPAPQDQQDQNEETQTAPRRTIRVLENPYDIASFYRSHQGDYFGYQGPGAAERYPIAGFYRQNGGRPYGYSRFWSNGYGYSGRGRTGLVIGYRHRIGDNGDLYLFAPFLAPVGPLSGIFLGER
jgi:hypothetical protein